jgi:hypothetical protein
VAIVLTELPARIIPAQQARAVLVVVNQVALLLQLTTMQRHLAVLRDQAAARNFFFFCNQTSPKKSLRLAENKNLQIYVPEHFRRCGKIPLPSA